jgi:hypothetical protein
VNGHADIKTTNPITISVITIPDGSTNELQRKNMLYNTTLHDDIWYIVIPYLTTRDWIQLSYANRAINQIKYYQPLMINKPRTLKGILLDNVVIEHWKSCYNTLFNVILLNSLCTDKSFLFLGINNNLHSMSLINCDGITSNAFYNLTNLKQLTLTQCYGVMCNCLERLYNIEELSITSCSYIRSLNQLSGQYLKCLHVTGIEMSNLSRFPNLRVVVCSGDPCDDNSFQDTKITKLVLSQCRISDRALQHVGQTLEELTLMYCPHVTDAAFDYLTGLKNKKIVNCPLIVHSL